MFGITKTQDPQYCVIGLGVFGRHLCRHLASLSAQVLAIDCREENVAAVKDYASAAIELDFNNLARFGNYSLEKMDAVFIAIGDDFEASMTLTARMQELKVKKLIVRVLSPMHEHLLNLLGVDRIVVPEEFAARGLAHSIMMRGAVDGYDLGDGHIIVEAETPNGLVGRTLREATEKFRRNSILLVTIIPVAIGCTLNYIYGKRECFPTIQSLMPGISVTCLAFIVGGVISTVHDDLVARGMMLFLWTFAVVFCHNTLGYCLGWLAGKLAGFNTAKKRTISIEVGMQNAGLATVLAGNFFAAQPLAVLPCAISCAWHSISGTILAGIYLKWDKMHGKN